MKPSQLKERLESLCAGTRAEVVDLTGTEDHYQATIISPAFEGKLMIEQHRMVFQLVQSEVDSGEVHALTLKTFTPKKYEEKFGRS
ncbi:BolA family transcriptional regulator [bacterium]|jgi:stress-induced morphogen|nr:BolA family transcriptional regulator [bacterium]